MYQYRCMVCDEQSVTGDDKNNKRCLNSECKESHLYLPPTKLETFPPIRYRHLKTGVVYKILYDAQMQVDSPLDMARVVVYQAENGSSVWVRPYSEFMDGRFQVIT